MRSRRPDRPSTRSSIPPWPPRPPPRSRRRRRARRSRRTRPRRSNSSRFCARSRDRGCASAGLADPRRGPPGARPTAGPRPRGHVIARLSGAARTARPSWNRRWGASTCRRSPGSPSPHARRALSRPARTAVATASTASAGRRQDRESERQARRGAPRSARDGRPRRLPYGAGSRPGPGRARAPPALRISRGPPPRSATPRAAGRRSRVCHRLQRSGS